MIILAVQAHVGVPVSSVRINHDVQHVIDKAGDGGSVISFQLSDHKGFSEPLEVTLTLSPRCDPVLITTVESFSPVTPGASSIAATAVSLSLFPPVTPDYVPPEITFVIDRSYSMRKHLPNLITFLSACVTRLSHRLKLIAFNDSVSVLETDDDPSEFLASLTADRGSMLVFCAIFLSEI